MKRPGIMIPVFFLSSIGLSGQFPVREAAIISLAGSFASAPGYSSTEGNQAGLGWMEGRTVSINQSLPFLTRGLAFSSIGMQCGIQGGGIGAHLSVLGIPGIYQSSLWFSYGLRLFTNISAGVGINYCNTSTPERFFHHPGVSCALGIQVRFGEDWMVGGHVMHPAGWSREKTGPAMNRMMISSGFSYRFFKRHTYYGEFHLVPGPGWQLCQGIRTAINDRVHINFGFHNQPGTISGGVECIFPAWKIQFAFEYMADTGSTPHATLAYEW